MISEQGYYTSPTGLEREINICKRSQGISNVLKRVHVPKLPWEAKEMKLNRLDVHYFTINIKKQGPFLKQDGDGSKYPLLSQYFVNILCTVKFETKLAFGECTSLQRIMK